MTATYLPRAVIVIPRQTAMDKNASIPSPRKGRCLKPTSQSFRSQEILLLEQQIEKDRDLLSLSRLMFQQIPHSEQYKCDPAGAPQLTNYVDLLLAIDSLIQQAPTWKYSGSNQQALIGFPINALLVSLPSRVCYS